MYTCEQSIYIVILSLILIVMIVCAAHDHYQGGFNNNILT